MIVVCVALLPISCTLLGLVPHDLAAGGLQAVIDTVRLGMNEALRGCAYVIEEDLSRAQQADPGSC